MHPRPTADLLKSWALEAGFDRAGVAQLAPLEHGEALVRWLERGDQAGMEYLGRRVEARLDPSQVFAGARSVLCVALQYHPLYQEDGERQPEPSGDLWRRVARYARGRDYHEVMGERLRILEERIRAAFPGCETRRYVDTGPVLERELAARAGMGAVGKNTMLLHPEGGSWFLLGELFLSLDVDPGPVQPLEDLCGSCTRCLEACPTGALAEPYRLDSNRCISYWTIEHRGALPEEARRMVGGWVFGCDVCQEVCPWNAEAAGAVHPEMELPPERGELTLARLLGLPREEYVERFRGSPMKRAKLEGLAAERRRGDGESPGVPVCWTSRGSSERRGAPGARPRGLGAGADRGRGGPRGPGGGARRRGGRGRPDRDPEGSGPAIDTPPLDPYTRRPEFSKT